MSDLLDVVKDILKNVEAIKKDTVAVKEGYVFNVTGTTNPIRVNINNPIRLKNKKFKVCFKKFVGTNSIKNITTSNNTFAYRITGGSDRIVRVPPGIYAAVSDDVNIGIADTINNSIVLYGSDKFVLGIDTATSNSWITMPAGFTFAAAKSTIAPLLGFTGTVYTTDKTLPLSTYTSAPEKQFTQVVVDPGEKITSENEVFVSDLNLILINCNLVASGTSYINNIETQALRSFAYNFYPWEQMVYEPNTLEYHNLVGESISDILITITDQNLKVLDFGSQQITVVIEIIEI